MAPAPAPAPTAQIKAPIATASPTPDVETIVTTALARDRIRIRAILESQEAVGRQESAFAIALTSGIDLHSARRLLNTMQPDGYGESDAWARRVAGFAQTRSSSSSPVTAVDTRGDPSDEADVWARRVARGATRTRR